MLYRENGKANGNHYSGSYRDHVGYIGSYIGKMEKKIEATIYEARMAEGFWAWGFRSRV